MSSGPHLSYRAVMALPGFRRISASFLLARTGGQMQTVALVLFSLTVFRSPQIAGLSVLAILPGQLLSPVAGTLLDRHGRVRLILADYCVAAVGLAVIGGCALAGVLTPWLMLALVAISSLTYPLSGAGARAVWPAVVPRAGWDRANALDSASLTASAILGPALAGGLVATVGARGTLLLVATAYAAAAALLGGSRVPEGAPAAAGPLLHEAAAGLRYVLAHPTLRSLAIALSISGIGWGILTVGLPVLILHRLHDGPAMVGLLWALGGMAGVGAGLVAGHRGTHARERRVIVRMLALGGLGLGAVLLAATPAGELGAGRTGALLLAALGLVVVGGADGPLTTAMFSMRQRRTDPAWYGRAFAVSMSLNYAGTPIGAGIGGMIVATSLVGALGAAATVAALAALLAAWLLPGTHRPADRAPAVSAG